MTSKFGDEYWDRRISLFINANVNECGTHSYCPKASNNFTEYNRNKLNNKKREILFILPEKGYEPEKG